MDDIRERSKKDPRAATLFW